MNNSKKGRGIIKLFLLLSAAAGCLCSFSPYRKRMPSLAEKVNAFRGYYKGPLFVDPAEQSGTVEKEYFTNQYHGIKDTMKGEQLYYFIPAADIKLVFLPGMNPLMLQSFLIFTELMT